MNHYEFMGVPMDASQEQIAKVYRLLAQQYHPDINGNDPEKIEKMKQLTAAYDVLKDPSKRHRYNLSLPKRLNKAKKKPTKGPIDYNQDPNLGHYVTPQAPTHDIWGRKLSEAERAAWHQNAASEIPGALKPLPPKKKPVKHSDDFIDVFAKQYMKEKTIDLR